MIWLTDFFERGGPVLYAVLLTAVFLWVLICLRLWFFYIERKRFFEKPVSYTHLTLPTNDQV